MTGKNFCSAAWDSFTLILRNALRFSIVSGLGSIVLAFGQVFIFGLTTFSGYYIIENYEPWKSNVTNPMFPTIMFGLVGFLIGYIFMSVYGVVSDAILMIFTMDEEIEA